MSNNLQHIKLEFYWWIFTAFVVGAVLFPILSKVESYPFLVINAVFVIIFITFTRYIFLLKFTFLAHKKYLKFIIIVACIPVFFYLINQVNYFQTYLDEEGLEKLVSGLTRGDQASIGKYIRSEILLFGVGSIIAAIVLPFRLLLSIWRGYNRGTV